MLNGREEDLLKQHCEKLINSGAGDIAAFDFNAEADKSLSYSENKEILTKKIKTLFIVKQEVKRVDAITIKEYNERIDRQVIRQEEEAAEKEFLNSLYGIQNTESTEILDNYFYLLKEYCKMVATGHATGLLLLGDNGLGKTYNCLKALKESKTEFIYKNGFSSPLAFYCFLFENKEGKVLILDDMKSILKDERSLEILKAALFSPTGTRIISYDTTSTKLKYPHVAEFKSRIIMLVNDLSDLEKADLKAVIDRILFYKVIFSFKDKLKILAEISKLAYKELSQEQRQEIFNFIVDNTTQATININFRLLQKIYEIYLFDRMSWQKLARGIINNNKDIEILLQALNKHSTIEEACKEWQEITGKERRTFFYLKTKVQKCNEKYI